MVAAFGTFIALIISIWARDNGENVAEGLINAFIVCITIVVVAIPEGLPLAVTSSLASSTKKMYADQCFIRVRAYNLLLISSWGGLDRQKRFLHIQVNHKEIPKTSAVLFHDPVF